MRSCRDDDDDEGNRFLIGRIARRVHGRGFPVASENPLRAKRPLNQPPPVALRRTSTRTAWTRVHRGQFGV